VLILSDKSKGEQPITVNPVICGAPRRLGSQRLLWIKHRWPPNTHTEMPAPKVVILLSPASDDTTFHAKSHSIHNNWLSPTLQKDFQTYKNWHLKTLFGRRSRARTSPDGWVDRSELSSPPKKGCLFGNSLASDFVRRILGNTLLTKALNYYFELNFCRQWIYQWQPRICDTCRLDKSTIVSTLRNCFSESPWKGSGRQAESEKWLHT